MGTKINQLLQQWPSGNVATGRWLANLGIDRRLADKYVQSGWLERLGYGAYTRAGAAVDWLGAVHALQTQLGLFLHPGGRTALELRGYTHYLPFGVRPAVLFGSPGTKLPAWFLAQSWAGSVTLVTTGFLGRAERSTSSISVHAIDLEVASCERAALEMMYLVPRRQSYEEAFQLLESLTSLRPRVVQELLECCTSVKAKRLFMHAAERVNHPWLHYLDLSGVDFGSGRRTIHAGGRLDRKYDLVVADPTQA